MLALKHHSQSTEKSSITIPIWQSVCCTAHHASFHFIDGVEVELLFTAVDALDDVVGLGVVVEHQQAGQLAVKVLAQAVADP